MTGWAGTGLDRVLGETSTGNDTLLGAVHADAESPTIIVLVQHPDKLTGIEAEFILHGRFEVKLNTVDIIRGGSRAI